MSHAGFTKNDTPSGSPLATNPPLNFGCSRRHKVKHTIADDVNVNVKVDIPAEDLGDLIDKVVDAAITITVVVTAAQIVKGFLRP